MAVLSDGERSALLKAFSTELSASRTPFNVSRADLRSAINAIDDWVDTNAVSFNQAIPQPARGALTTQQKAWLLMFVVRRRFEVS